MSTEELKREDEKKELLEDLELQALKGGLKATSEYGAWVKQGVNNCCNTTTTNEKEEDK
jgi:hypothetical protein